MFEVRELRTDEEISAAFPLVVQLRTHLERETFLTTVRAQQAAGYRLYGGFEAGQLVTAAGVRNAQTFSRGPHLFVDDLVTHDTEQEKGHATAMLRWLASDAKSRGLTRIFLDSRESAIGYYKQAGFEFIKATPCWIDVSRL
jgi:ribosomal protein S18 acetylase RimI-like enzyme